MIDLALTIIFIVAFFLLERKMQRRVDAWYGRHAHRWPQAHVARCEQCQAFIKDVQENGPRVTRFNWPANRNSNRK